MVNTLKRIGELKNKKIIGDFAISGSVAVLYYVEPLLTYDLDIFFIPVEESIDVLTPIYNYLRKKGYKFDKEHVIIEGIPVQFIPVYNELVNEAVLKSVEAKYGRIKTKVLGLEYLVAIMIQTYRAKDRERLIKIFEEAEMDLRLLRKILKKYNLHDKYTEFRRRYFDNK